MTKVKKSIWSKLGYALLSFALVVTTLFASVSAVAKAEVTNSEKRHFQDGLSGYINVNEETGAIEQKNYDTSILVNGFDGDDAEYVIELFLAKKDVYDRFTAEDKATPEAFLQTALMVFENVWDDVFAAPEAVKTRINDELAPLLTQEGGVKYSDKGTFLSVKAAFEALDANQQTYVMYKGKEAAEENYTEEYQTYLAVKNALEAIEARLDALVEKIEGVEQNAGDLDTMLAEGVKLSDETAFLAIEAEYLALPDLEGSIYTEKKYVDARVTHDAEAYAECPTDVVNIELVRAALNAIKARLDNIYDMIVSTDREVQDMNVLTHVAYVRPLGHMVEYGVHVSDSETFGTIDGYYQAVVDETEKAYLDGKLAEVEQMLDDTSAYTAPETNVYNIEYVREALLQKEEQLNALVAAIVNTTEDVVSITIETATGEEIVDVTPLGYILANFDYSYKADFDYVDGAYRLLGGDALEYVNDALAEYNQIDEEEYPTEGDYPYLTSVVNIELLRALFDEKEAYLNDLVAAIEQDNDEEQVVVEYEDGEEEIERPLHFMTLDGVVYADKADFDFIDAAYAALTEAEKAYVDARVTPVEEGAEYTNQVTDVKFIEDVREALTSRETELNELIEKIEGEVLGEDELDTMLENGVVYADKAAFDAIDEEYANLTDEEREYVNNNVTVDEEEYANYETQVRNIEEVRKALEAIEARLDELVKRIVSNDRYEVGEGNDVELVTPLGYMLGTGVDLEYEEEFNAVDEEYANLTEAEKAYVDARLARYQQMLTEDELEEYTAPVTNVRNIEEVREALNKIKTALNWLVKAINDTEEFEMPVADVAMFLPDELTEELEETIVVKPLGKMLADGVKLEDLQMFLFIDGAYASLVEEDLEAELAYVNERVTAVEEGAEYTNQVTEVKNLEEVREALVRIYARLNLLVRRLSETEDFEVDGTTYRPVYYFVAKFFSQEETTDEEDVTLMNELLEYEETFNALDAEYKALEGAEKEYVDSQLEELDIIFDPTNEFNIAFFGEEPETYVASLEFYRFILNMCKEALDKIVEYIESDVQLTEKETENEEVFNEETQEWENKEVEVEVVVDPLHYMTLRGVVYSDKAFFDEIDELYRMLFGASKDYVDARVTPVEEGAEYTNQLTDVKYIEDVREALLQREAELDLLVRKIVETENFEVDETEYTPLGYVLRQEDILAYEEVFNAVDEEYRGLSDAEKEYIDGQLVDFEQIDEETYVDCPTYVVNIEEIRARLQERKNELDLFIKAIENEEPFEIEEDQDVYTVDPLHYMTIRGVNYNTDKEFFDELDAAYAELTDAERAYVDARVTPVEEGAEYTNQVTDVKYIEDVREALAARETELDALVEKIEGEELGENELDTMLENGVRLSDKAAFDAIDEEYQALEGAEKAYVDGKVTAVEEGAEYTAPETEVKNIEEVREELRRLLDELHDRINDVIDGENTDMDNIDDIIDEHDNNMDDDQLDDLADAFEDEYDDYWQEFLDAVKKLRFAMFFKQAVQEVYDQVTDRDYFTVEGYAVEKMLNSMYCSFAFTEFGNGKTLQDLVKDPCEEQLAEIDALYEELDEDGNLVHTRYDYAALEKEVNDLLDPNNEDSLAYKVADLASRLAAAEGQLDPETEGSLAAEVAAIQEEVAALLDPNNEDSLVSRLAAIEAELNPEDEGSLAAKVAALLAEINPETEGSLAAKVAALLAQLDPQVEGSIAAELNSAKERLTALEGEDTLIEQELATLRANIQKEMKQLKDDNQKEVDALKAENEQLKKDLDEKTDKLNKTILIGLIALGVVAVALVACVAVLFGKTKALANGGSSKKDEE